MNKRAFVFLFLLSLGIPCAAGRIIVGVTTSNQLVFFDSATPGTMTAPVLITGLVSGDQIHEIDYRPANGILYALGINPGTNPNTGRIYSVNTATAVATQIGTNFSTALSNGASYGFDFIPTENNVRVTNSANQNIRVNPDTGLRFTNDPSLNPPAVPSSAPLMTEATETPRQLRRSSASIPRIIGWSASAA